MILQLHISEPLEELAFVPFVIPVAPGHSCILLNDVFH